MKKISFRRLCTAGALVSTLLSANAAQAQAGDMATGMDKTIEFTKFENHADPKALTALLRQREAIEARSTVKGKARYWAANLCGNDADAFYVMTEFPSSMSLAEARQDPKAVEAMRKWEYDARTKGLSLKSRSLLVSLGTPESVVPPAGSHNAPPHTLQFAEFDPAGKFQQLIESFMRGAKFTRENAGEDTGARGFWMVSGAGDHPMNVVTTAEFASRSAMLRMVSKVDHGPKFMKRVFEMQALGVKRVSECIMTEVLP